MTDLIGFKKFYPNYFSFLVNGAMVLLIGAILPFLIQEAHLSYTVAGSLLSAFAIGNFLASFINPFLSKKIGRKASIVLTSTFLPVVLFSLTYLPPVWLMTALFVLLGIGRGAYSIINNAYINENSQGSPFALNILHMIFAVGAFAAPMIMSLFMKAGYTWRAITYVLGACSIISICLLFKLNLTQNYNKPSTNKANLFTDRPFFKQTVFWISGLILFFYLGLENCVNGWFVTYLKNTNIMSQLFANSLVSFTWLAVLLGRLFTAIISTRVKKQLIILVDCIATAVFFIMLIATQSLILITISIIGLGFFFAGIYATTVANAHKAIRGSDLGTSMLLAIAALGGIITPQIVGSVADKIGLTGAISILTVNVVAMIVLSAVNVLSNKNN